jgi:hypothetical protein
MATYREVQTRFDFLLSDAQRGFNRRVCELVYDGRPFGDSTVMFAQRDRAGSRYKAEYGEAVGMAHLLVAAGLPVQSFVKAKPPQPDFRVELGGETVHIEFARVISQASARHAGLVDQINVGIARRFSADPSLRKSMRERFFQVRLPRTPQTIDDCRSVVDEIFAVATAAAFGPNMIMGRVLVHYPLLHFLGAKWFARAGKATAFAVQIDAACFDPHALLGRVVEIIEQKKRKRYRASGPWLALYLAEIHALPQITLAQIRSMRLDLGQFERLVVGDGSNALVIPSLERGSRGVSRRSGLAADAS